MDRLFFPLNTVLLVVSGFSLGFFLDYPSMASLFAVAFFCCGTFLLLIRNNKEGMSVNNRVVLANISAISIISLVSLVEIVHLFTDKNVISIIRMFPLIVCTLALYFAYWFILIAKPCMSEHVKVPELLARVLSGPSIVLALLMAIPVTVFMLLVFINIETILFELVATKFTQRGIIPPLTLLIFIWALLLLLNKFIVLYAEKNAFIKDQDKSHIIRAFEITVYDHKNAQAYQDKVEYFTGLIWKTSSDFYTLPRYINWAIPILGFIGTVLGISMAAEGIQHIISNQQGASEISQHLGDAISPLGIAFDTTLIALSLSVLLVLIQTSLQRFENGLLIDIESELRNKYSPDKND